MWIDRKKTDSKKKDNKVNSTKYSKRGLYMLLHTRFTDTCLHL